MRQYDMYINNTLTVSNYVEVVDPWNFKQTLSQKLDDGTGAYIYMEVYFDGQTWR